MGGHHKIPMAELRNEMQKLNFEKVETLLNSGNIIFDAVVDDLERLESRISEHLEKTFGFPVPTMIRTANTICTLTATDPFKQEPFTKDTSLYISFLRKKVTSDLKLPWISDDNSYKILSVSDRIILSVLDLSISKTPKAMQALERSFGTDITTRNWNTIKRIEKKLKDY